MIFLLLLQFDTLFMRKELPQVALKLKETCHLLTLLSQPTLRCR